MQTSWLFTKRDRRFELGTTEKQIPLVVALNLGPPDYNTSAPNHSATLPPVHISYVLQFILYEL